jgi:hypothetical protein
MRGGARLRLSTPTRPSASPRSARLASGSLASLGLRSWALLTLLLLLLLNPAPALASGG